MVGPFIGFSAMLTINGQPWIIGGQFVATTQKFNGVFWEFGQDLPYIVVVPGVAHLGGDEIVIAGGKLVHTHDMRLSP